MLAVYSPLNHNQNFCFGSYGDVDKLLTNWEASVKGETGKERKRQGKAGNTVFGDR